jgi:hypothetical protein
MFKTRLLHSGWHLSANVDTLYLGFPVTYLVGEAVGIGRHLPESFRSPAWLFDNTRI